MKHHLTAILIILAGCEAEDRLATEPRVESFKESSYYEVAFSKTGDLEWASGAVHVPTLDANGVQLQTGGDNIRATCGVTFVTPKHAITAAHCVDGTDVHDPPNQTLWVEMYNVSPSFDWWNFDALNGAFPSFSSPMNSIGTAEGYNIDPYPCELVVRCGTQWGPMIDCNLPDVDLALLECAGEPGNDYGYMDASPTETPGERAYMAWSHELYDVDPSNPDHIAHYVNYGPKQNNYHYFEEGQLLPMRSKGDWYGDLFLQPRIGGTYSNFPTVTWSNLFGCHGTSGSGVARLNQTSGHHELLGPVALGSTELLSTLCHPSDMDPFVWGMGHTKPEYTYELTRRAQCGEIDGNLLLWLWCHRGRFYEEEMKFPDFGFDWPMVEGPPVERWRVTNEPAAEYPIGRPELAIPFGTPAKGSSVRISVHAVALEEALDAPVELWFGEEPVAELSLDGEQRSAKLTARVDGDGWSTVSVRYAGERPLGLTELTLADDGRTNGFDTMTERAGVGRVDDEGFLVPMRFVRVPDAGFAARLEPGETMAITRQAFVRDAESRIVRLSVEGDADGIQVQAYDADQEEPVAVPYEADDGLIVADLSELRLPVAVTITAPAEGEPLQFDGLAVAPE